MDFVSPLSFFVIISLLLYIYNREIKMYFYLALMGFEPTPTSTAAPSNTETTVIPSRPLRSLKKGIIMAEVYA